jgi:hypothetical protein
MYSDDSALKQLSRDECLRLMASVPVGFSRRCLACPAWWPAAGSKVPGFADLMPYKHPPAIADS